MQWKFSMVVNGYQCFQAKVVDDDEDEDDASTNAKL